MPTVRLQPSVATGTTVKIIVKVKPCCATVVEAVIAAAAIAIATVVSSTS